MTARQKSEEKLRAVLNWMLEDSGCDVRHSWYYNRLVHTPEPLRSLVAAEINAFRQKRGVDDVPGT